MEMTMITFSQSQYLLTRRHNPAVAQSGSPDAGAALAASITTKSPSNSGNNISIPKIEREHVL
jgi:hypothetical protein